VVQLWCRELLAKKARQVARIIREKFAQVCTYKKDIIPSEIIKKAKITEKEPNRTTPYAAKTALKKTLSPLFSGCPSCPTK